LHNLCICNAEFKCCYGWNFYSAIKPLRRITTYPKLPNNSPLPWEKNPCFYGRGQLLTQKYFCLAIIPKFFYFWNFLLKYYFFFFLNLFFTTELSHFLGTKNSKKIVFSGSIFCKMFFVQKYFFEFCVPKKVTKFCSNKKNWKKNIIFTKKNLEVFF